MPFLVWRSVVAQKQVDVAAEALFNDKINAAADDLHARRAVTQNPGGKECWDVWQDDMVRRNAAIDRLEGLANERPEIIPRIARMLCVYVRERSGEHRPKAVPDGATSAELRDWVHSLSAGPSDMENAAQTLGRLQAITGADPVDKLINLSRANLQRFDLQGAIFKKARLHRAQMQRAYLRRAQMQGADLTGARMDSATFLTDAALRGAVLKSVDLFKVAISQAQVDEVFYDGSVRFPEGITRAAGREEKLDWSDFETQWRAWQKSIGYDPQADKA